MTRALALAALALASCTPPPAPTLGATAPLGFLLAVALLGRALYPRLWSPSPCTFPVPRRTA